MKCNKCDASFFEKTLNKCEKCEREYFCSKCYCKQYEENKNWDLKCSSCGNISHVTILIPRDEYEYLKGYIDKLKFENEKLNIENMKIEKCK